MVYNTLLHIAHEFEKKTLIIEPDHENQKKIRNRADGFLSLPCTWIW